MELLNEFTIIGVVGLLVPIILMIFARRILTNHSSKLEQKLIDHKVETNMTMSSTLLKLISSVSPRIVYCPDTPALTQECIAMINKAVDDYSAHRKLVEEVGDKDIDEKKKETVSFINIYGAANIERSSGGESVDHHAEFHSSLDRAMQSGLRVQRYINLPTVEFFNSRSPEKQTEYYEWITHEIDIIKKSSNYDLIMNPRAPGWEGAATMVTNSGIVEIKGGGMSGLAIYDSALASSIRFSVRKDLRGASPENQIIVNSHKHIELIEAIRDEMKKIL